MKHSVLGHLLRGVRASVKASQKVEFWNYLDINSIGNIQDLQRPACRNPGFFMHFLF